jgi:hypothetical protein
MQRAEARWHLLHFGDSREQRSYVGNINVEVSLLLYRHITKYSIGKRFLVG